MKLTKLLLILLLTVGYGEAWGAKIAKVNGVAQVIQVHVNEDESDILIPGEPGSVWLEELKVMLSGKVIRVSSDGSRASIKPDDAQWSELAARYLARAKPGEQEDESEIDEEEKEEVDLAAIQRSRRGTANANSELDYYSRGSFLGSISILKTDLVPTFIPMSGGSLTLRTRKEFGLSLNYSQSKPNLNLARNRQVSLAYKSGFGSTYSYGPVFQYSITSLRHFFLRGQHFFGPSGFVETGVGVRESIIGMSDVDSWYYSGYGSSNAESSDTTNKHLRVVTPLLSLGLAAQPSWKQGFSMRFTFIEVLVPLNTVARIRGLDSHEWQDFKDNFKDDLQAPSIRSEFAVGYSF